MTTDMVLMVITTYILGLGGGTTQSIMKIPRNECQWVQKQANGNLSIDFKVYESPTRAVRVVDCYSLPPPTKEPEK